MTHYFVEDYQDRKRQVRHYLAVVARTEREVGLGASRPQEGRLLTLRAGTFLVLYNLIEATARGAIEAIHDGITSSGAPFPQLTLSLRQEIVRLFKRGADPGKNHTMENFPSGFVAVALAQRPNLAGSVDAKAIRELGERYGFSCATNSQVTWNGSDLLTVKSNRNDLAHGTKTYEQVGRDHTGRQLLLLTRRSLFYMNDIVSNVAGYLDNNGYLEAPQAPVVPAHAETA